MAPELTCDRMLEARAEIWAWLVSGPPEFTDPAPWHPLPVLHRVCIRGSTLAANVVLTASQLAGGVPPLLLLLSLLQAASSKPAMAGMIHFLIGIVFSVLVG
jgi:hypothetical protein